MLNLSKIRQIAKIDRETLPNSNLPISLPFPHRLAARVIQELGGQRFRPIASWVGVDVIFASNAGVDFQQPIMQLRNVLQLDLVPVAESDNGNGVLLLAPDGVTFGLSLSAHEVSYFESLEEAVIMLLQGKDLTPVLPVRLYDQEFNWEIIKPGDPRVVWVDTPTWIANTKY